MLTRAIFRKIFLGIAIMLITLLYWEMGYRFLARFTTTKDLTPALRPHPQLVTEAVPSSPGYDVNGFSNRNTREKYDVVVLGDSHTHGEFLPTRDMPDVSWPAQLASQLGVSVYNMGMWGYGTAQYAHLLPKALSLHPDVVVVGLLLNNDLFDAYDVVYHQEAWGANRHSDFIDTTPHTSQDDAKLVNTHLQGPREFLYAHSAIYRLASGGSRTLREELGLASPRIIGTDDWSTTDSDASLRYRDPSGNRDTLFWTGYSLRSMRHDDKNVQEGMRLSKEFLGKMANETAAAGVKLVILLIPNKISVYSPLVKKSSFSNQLYDLEVADEAANRDEILTFCKTIKATCVDPLPRLQEVLEGGEDIYPPDWNDHPNEEGYGIYAASVADTLRREFPRTK